MAFRRHRPIALAILAGLLMTGCSSKAWYGGMKLSAENECRRLPPGESEACLARQNTMTYEEYERRRSGQNM